MLLTVLLVAPSLLTLDLVVIQADEAESVWNMTFGGENLGVASSADK